MRPRLPAVRARVNTDGAAPLQPDASKAAGQEAGDPTGRDRLLPPVTTRQRFLWQILQGHTAGSHWPQLSGLRCRASASGHARTTRPLDRCALLLARCCTAVQSHVADEGRWHGQRPCLVEGSGCSLPESLGVAGRLRSINGAAAGVRRARRPALRVVPRGHRGAPDVGGRATLDARSCPGAGGPSDPPAGGWPRGGSGPGFVGPWGPPRPRRRAGGAAPRGATERRGHARSALGPAECAADTGRQRASTLTRAHRLGSPRPPRDVGEAEAPPVGARPQDVGGHARGIHAPRGPRAHRHAGVPDPPDHPGDHAPRRGELPWGRPRRALPLTWAGRQLSGPPEDDHAQGRAPRPDHDRRAQRTARLRPQLSLGALGHLAIGTTPAGRRGTHARSGCAAVAGDLRQGRAASSLAGHSCPSRARGPAGAKAAAESRAVHDHTPTRTPPSAGTTNDGGVTSCHSPKSPHS
jgi:hypothetical protein